MSSEADAAMPQHKSEAFDDRKRKKELAEARQSGKVSYIFTQTEREPFYNNIKQ
jgi:hypothetical protein